MFKKTKTEYNDLFFGAFGYSIFVSVYIFDIGTVNAKVIKHYWERERECTVKDDNGNDDDDNDDNDDERNFSEKIIYTGVPFTPVL